MKDLNISELERKKQRLNRYLNELWGDIENTINDFAYEMEYYLEENECYEEEYRAWKILNAISFSVGNIQGDLERHLRDKSYIDLNKIYEFELIFRAIVSYLDDEIQKFKDEDLLDFKVKGLNYLVLSKCVIKCFLFRCEILKKEINL